jgi:DNA-binding NarL/FixJ family response regulator
VGKKPKKLHGTVQKVIKPALPSEPEKAQINIEEERVLIADDHEIVRQGIRTIVESCEGFEVCGEASDGRQAVQMALTLKPDIVVVDIGMPRLNGLEATRQILRNDSKVKVLVLTMHESEQIVRDVLTAGARGYLLKSDAGLDLILALEALSGGTTFFTSKVAQSVLDTFLNSEPVRRIPKYHITAREREVVQLLAEGKSSKEVAVALNLSVKTAETHRSNLMRKLDIHSVSEVVRYAVRNNIIHVAQSPPV